MEIPKAVKALSALSQESRLRAFRLLVRSGIEGMAAGRIADALDIPHNTLSTHLGTLVNAGLVSSRRESRSIIYSIDFDGTRELFSFLMEECCEGNRDICLPVLESLLPRCCDPTNPSGVKS
jgi:DNA-binding transcriptional ArsR family regulator